MPENMCSWIQSVTTGMLNVGGNTSDTHTPKKKNPKTKKFFSFLVSFLASSDNNRLLVYSDTSAKMADFSKSATVYG